MNRWFSIRKENIEHACGSFKNKKLMTAFDFVLMFAPHSLSRSIHLLTRNSLHHLDHFPPSLTRLSIHSLFPAGCVS